MHSQLEDGHSCGVPAESGNCGSLAEGENWRRMSKRDCAMMSGGRTERSGDSGVGRAEAQWGLERVSERASEQALDRG